MSGCTPAPAPAIDGAAESATGSQSLDLAAGQLFTIYGTRLGPPLPGVAAQLDASRHLPVTLSGVQVTVNGIAAPLLFASDKQINAIVPFDLAGPGTARVVVTVSGVASDVYQAPIGDFGPAIFNYPIDKLGYRPFYVWMLNADGTINSPSHPAKWGSAVAMFATGTGATIPAGEDGAQAGTTIKRSAFPVSILVNGEPMSVLYSGSAPSQVEGITQINLQLPAAPSSDPSGSATMAIAMGVKLPWARTLSFYAAP